MEIRSGQVALVTGAGSGIGRETALALARKGVKLIICDVNSQRLNDIEQELGALTEVLIARVIDVSDRQKMSEFAEQVHDHVDALDILVNNAGVGAAGPFVDVPLEEWDRLYAVNVMGVVTGCYVFLPKMLEAGGPRHIVNIASMAAYTPAPRTSCYASSKAAVLSLSECLQSELRETDIGVSTICPGIVHTNIVRATTLYGEIDPEKRTAEIEERYRTRGYAPRQVANAILVAIEKNRKLVPVTPEAWVLYWLGRINVRLRNFLLRIVRKRRKGLTHNGKN